MPSFFLSWDWIETWIKCLPRKIDVNLVLLSAPGFPEVAFFVGVPSAKPSLAGVKRLFLNYTGVQLYDKLYIEYNSILVENDQQISLYDILSSLPFKWDEFVLPGLDPASFPGNALRRTDFPYNIEATEVASPFVDLDKVRDHEFEYLGLLSKNTRSQIRRSCQLYQQKESLRFTVASSREQAICIFMELMHLHQISWRRRGRQGSFSSDFFVRFHRQLIERCFNKGKVQLAKLCCGEKTIACLYNFIENGDVYFYQSGLAASENNKYKPGLMVHAEAIKYNSMLGHHTYDFLAGSSQYKKSLSTDEKILIWAKIQKKIVKNRVNNYMKKNYKLLRSYLTR